MRNQPLESVEPRGRLQGQLGVPAADDLVVVCGNLADLLQVGVGDLTAPDQGDAQSIAADERQMSA